MFTQNPYIGSEEYLVSLLTLLTIVHLTFAILLIIFVLLQDSKGGAMGILGGGGSSNTVFGTGGAVSFLVKATRWIAICFAFTCISLAYLSTNSKDSVTDQFIPTETPAVQKEDPETNKNTQEEKK